MKRIGITVGSDEDSGVPCYFKKNKKKFLILDDMIDSSNGYPYDYAIFAEAKLHHNKLKTIYPKSFFINAKPDLKY